MTPTLTTSCVSLPPEGAVSALRAAGRALVTPTLTTSCVSL
jgi:hypothetical protein